MEEHTGIKVQVTKSPGYDWLVQFHDEDGSVLDMTVFGKIKIEDALEEARRSLSFNFFDDPDFVEPVIVAIERMDLPKLKGV